MLNIRLAIVDLHYGRCRYEFILIDLCILVLKEVSLMMKSKLMLPLKYPYMICYLTVATYVSEVSFGGDKNSNYKSLELQFLRLKERNPRTLG